MKKDKSYSEMMKACAMAGNNQLKKSFVTDIYIEMLIQEIHLTKEKEVLVNAINEALDCKNKEKFMELSRRYIEVLKKFGN